MTARPLARRAAAIAVAVAAGWTSPGPARALQIAPVGTAATVRVDGRDRLFYYHLPPGPRMPHPVVLAFHGAHGSAADVEQLSGLDFAADSAGFVAVYPQADVPAGRVWALGCAGCSAADFVGISDRRFVSAILDTLARAGIADTTRAFGIGFSMGGSMVNRLICTAPSLFRGAAFVGTPLDEDFATGCTGPPLPIVLVVGTADPGVPWEGNRARRYPELGPLEWLRRMGTRNRCGRAVDSSSVAPTVELFALEGCAPGAPARLYRVAGLGHMWPTTEFPASIVLLQLFARPAGGS